MKFTDFRHTYDLQRDRIVEDFSKWSEQLVNLLESRVFGGDFELIFNRLLSFNEDSISNLTDDEREQQLTLCSQIKASFDTLGDELGLYLSKTKRRYESWTAQLYINARQKVIDQKHAEFLAGKITKAAVTTTGDEVKNQFLVDNEVQNALWHDFIDHVTRAHNLVKNISNDIEHRSMILMNQNKRRSS